MFKLFLLLVFFLPLTLCETSLKTDHVKGIYDNLYKLTTQMQQVVKDVKTLNLRVKTIELKAGPSGPKGDKGESGATGATGITGAKGQKGTGFTGAKGQKGTKGQDYTKAKVAFMGMGPVSHYSSRSVRITGYSEVTDMSGNFNPSNGIFYTPQSGVYYFGFSLYCYAKSRSCHAQLMRNNRAVCGAINNGKNHITIGNTAVIYLKSGDQISIQGAGNIFGGNHYMFFTGFLLF